MNREKMSATEVAALRSQAEEEIATHPGGARFSSLEKDAKRLVHELQIYQIELEMQNLELRQTQVKLEQLREGDIAGRLRAELLQGVSEAKYQLLIDNTYDIIYTLSADGIFSFVSPAWTLLLGHTVSQVKGESFHQFVHPDDLPSCLAWLQKVIKTGQRQSGLEYRVRHLDGTWYWHTSSAVPLKDETGIVTGYYGIAKDITKRKLVEAELLQKIDELQRFHALTVERELTMIELKKEVNGLLKKSGQSGKYRIVT